MQMFTLINLFVYAFIHVLGKPVLYLHVRNQHLTTSEAAAAAITTATQQEGSND